MNRINFLQRASLENASYLKRAALLCAIWLLLVESREFIVECEEPVRARIETYHYPNWVARLDGREIKIDDEPGTGLMLIDLSAGTHGITVTFEPRNQIETWAHRLSLLTWGLFAGWIIRKYLYAMIRHRRIGRAIAGSTAT